MIHSKAPARLLASAHFPKLYPFHFLTLYPLANVPPPGRSFIAWEPSKTGREGFGFLPPPIFVVSHSPPHFLSSHVGAGILLTREGICRESCIILFAGLLAACQYIT
jgi:hypothetical protein